MSTIMYRPLGSYKEVRMSPTPPALVHVVCIRAWHRWARHWLGREWRCATSTAVDSRSAAKDCMHMACVLAL